MKKLTLRLDALEVQSFSITSSAGGHAGTISAARAT